MSRTCLTLEQRQMNEQAAKGFAGMGNCDTRMIITPQGYVPPPRTTTRDGQLTLITTLLITPQGSVAPRVIP